MLTPSGHIAQHLGLEDILALLVLLARLVRLVVLPAHDDLAVAAHDVAHDVLARRHVAFGRLSLRDVDDLLEEVRLAVLAAEVSADDLVVSAEMGSTSSAAIDF